MSKMELSKESLYLLAKKISNHSLSGHLINSSKILKTSNDSFSVLMNAKDSSKALINNGNESDEQRIYKKIKIKNKFLEKNNIHINEEKMRNILNEKKY
jgi:hypothetical protein